MEERHRPCLDGNKRRPWSPDDQFQSDGLDDQALNAVVSLFETNRQPRQTTLPFAPVRATSDVPAARQPAARRTDFNIRHLRSSGTSPLGDSGCCSTVDIRSAESASKSYGRKSSSYVRMTPTYTQRTHANSKTGVSANRRSQIRWSSPLAVNRVPGIWPSGLTIGVRASPADARQTNG